MNIFDRIKELLSGIPRPLVIEMGACDGNETVWFANTFPDATIIALEPVKELADIVAGRTELKGRIELVRMAIGKEDKKGQKLFVSGGNCVQTGQNFYGSSSIKDPLYAEQVFKGMKFSETTCDVITLDTLWKRNNSPVIDFIWSDIQAGEQDMIRGGMAALAYTRYLYTEVGEGDYYVGEIKLPQILEMLPGWEVVEDYGTDVRLRNTKFSA